MIALTTDTIWFMNAGCKNAQKAEVAFVTDSSASIGTDNYKKVLDFMEHIVDSFRVGIDAVRVATLLFDKYLHYDLELGQYSTKVSMNFYSPLIQ